MIAQRISADERFEIADLYAAYVAVLDSKRFDEWPEFFIEDCSYAIVPRENYDRGLPLATMSFESRGMLRDRVYGVTQTLFHEPYYQRHLITNALMRASDTGYSVESNYVVLRTKSGELSHVLSTGRSYDSLVRLDGRLLFATRTLVFDSELIPNSLIYPL